MTRRGFGALAVLVLTGGCDRAIHGVANAEDLIALPGQRWVIASSISGPTQPNGALYAIDAQDGHSFQLYPTALPLGRATIPGCPAEVPAAQFRPHGVSLSTDGRTLYVVNHGARELIEMFSVDPGPRLHWIGCAVTPRGFEQNSVAVAGDGAAYATVMRTPIDQARLDKTVGIVLRWSPRNGWKAVVGSAMISPNGILVRPDGSKLYVDSYAGRAIVELTRGASGTTRRSLSVGLMPDNIRWTTDGAIVAAGTRALPGGPAGCADAEAQPCHVPSAIALIDPVALKLRCVRAVDTSFATVAAPVGRELWISSLNGHSIQRLPRQALAPPHCE